MTETEWLASNNALLMFQWLKQQARSRRLALPHRQLRLFGCACCRVVWPLLPEVCRNAVEVSERFADDLAKKSELLRAMKATGEIQQAVKPANEYEGEPRKKHVPWAPLAMTMWVSSDSIHDVVEMTALTAEILVGCAAKGMLPPGEEAPSIIASLQRMGDRMREIFANPFAPVAFDPTWRTPTVVALAHAAYDERLPPGVLDPARLAVLADALEDAGCREGAILSHCRDEQSVPHVRGCWVVDGLCSRSTYPGGKHS